MAYENETLGALLSDPRIAPVAADAIRARNLKAEPLWNMTLDQLKNEHFFSGEIGPGMERLYRAVDSGEWYYPLYSEAECARYAPRRGVSLVWFPSEDPAADARPFILVVPGGGFVNVWNLTEGWPIAEQFNRLGYHAFILTYQVEGEDALLDRNMEDFARALRLIRDNAARFHVNGDRYITCGFSAGGYLVCLWNTGRAMSALACRSRRPCSPSTPSPACARTYATSRPIPPSAVASTAAPSMKRWNRILRSPIMLRGFRPPPFSWQPGTSWSILRTRSGLPRRWSVGTFTACLRSAPRAGTASRTAPACAWPDGLRGLSAGTNPCQGLPINDRDLTHTLKEGLP